VTGQAAAVRAVSGERRADAGTGLFACDLADGPDLERCRRDRYRSVGVRIADHAALIRESAMHRYVTRSAALDWLLDDHRTLAYTTGADLLAGTGLLAPAGI
jgi:hypothetical protein